MQRIGVHRVLRVMMMVMALTMVIGHWSLVFAQDGTTLQDLLDQFELYTFGGLMIAVLALEELVDRVWDLDGVASQVRSIVIGVVGGSVLALFNLFMFSDPAVCGGHPWYVCGPLIGLGAALSANFAFLLPAVRGILEGLGIRPRFDPGKPIGTSEKPVARLHVRG